MRDNICVEVRESELFKESGVRGGGWKGEAVRRGGVYSPFEVGVAAALGGRAESVKRR